MRLEKIFRNGIFEAIQAGGLDPREFDLDFGDTETRIAHRWSDSYFMFGGPWGNWEGSYVVGDAVPWPFHEYVWSNVEERVERWAAKLKKDLETPDLWAELQREREILSRTPDDAENTPFTPEEQAEIETQLREIKEYVESTYSLSQEQRLALEAGLDDLAAATKRLGRIDWRWKLCGFILATVVTDILPPEAVHQLLVMALHGLGHLFGGNGTPYFPPELPPPVA